MLYVLLAARCARATHGPWGPCAASERPPLASGPCPAAHSPGIANPAGRGFCTTGHTPHTPSCPRAWRRAALCDILRLNNKGPMRIRTAALAPGRGRCRGRGNRAPFRSLAPAHCRVIVHLILQSNSDFRAISRAVLLLNPAHRV